MRSFLTKQIRGLSFEREASVMLELSLQMSPEYFRLMMVDKEKGVEYGVDQLQSKFSPSDVAAIHGVLASQDEIEPFWTSVLPLFTPRFYELVVNPATEEPHSAVRQLFRDVAMERVAQIVAARLPQPHDVESLHYSHEDWESDPERSSAKLAETLPAKETP